MVEVKDETSVVSLVKEKFTGKDIVVRGEEKRVVKVEYCPSDWQEDVFKFYFYSGDTASVDIDGVVEYLIEELDCTDWYTLSFEDRLYCAHRVSLFPELSNKHTQEFMSMIFELLIDRTENMSDEEINTFFKGTK